MANLMSFHDPETGLPNRPAIAVLLGDILVREDDVAVVFFGIEQMTRTVEVHGAEAAGDVFRGVASRVRSSLPLSATLGRIGEALVALVPGSNAPFARILAWQAVERVREPMYIGGREIRPTVNVGIARRLPIDSVDRLLRDAGLTLRHAQSRGGGRVELFEDLPPDARLPDDGG